MQFLGLSLLLGFLFALVCIGLTAVGPSPNSESKPVTAIYVDSSPEKFEGIISKSQRLFDQAAKRSSVPKSDSRLRGQHDQRQGWHEGTQVANGIDGFHS